MILLSLGLFGFAVADLIRWGPEKVSRARACTSFVVSVVATAGMAALCGMAPAAVGAVAAGTAIAVSVWLSFDYLPSTSWLLGFQLAWVSGIFLALFAFSGSVALIGGTLEHWYEQLGLGFVELVPIDQFVVGVSAALFMTATGNRLVRLVLAAAGVSLKSESDVPGGRVLGPLERLIVFAIVLASDPAAAAIVITGKGLLRFPEIRRDSMEEGPDARTEYFLIGTFASLVLATLLAVLVLAAS